ncbi:dihydrofolate reductase family protein [Amycolatopsis sp. NBC_01307]|uniref:dihydrofolate reductase family protein n=1 Tax=Amycolatopsis sp. NBC_01307 TaxID=2903561 RepID=UPI002E11DC7D|nr:dihydrofolate reductase family protein [Amycolatopsis sp. NBC_01307]
MGKIVISENVSLDGVVQDPVGTEGFRFAGWFDRLGGEDREAWAAVEYEEALGTEALLLGRRTYEWFLAQGWATRDGAWADRLRAVPKYVVSSTPGDLEWNSTVLKGDLVDAVSRLKQEVAGDVVLYGSGRVAHALIEHDLVDELRLMVCPFALGEGERLFGRTGAVKPLRLVGNRTVGTGVVRLTYRPVRNA